MRTVLRRIVTALAGLLFALLIAPAVLFVAFVVVAAGLAAIAADRLANR